MTRIQRTYQQLPPSEAAEPLSEPAYTENLGTKSEGINAHSNWTRTVQQTDICAYSDGSSEGHGRSTWGYVLQRGGITFEKNSGILHGGEVYDAEIHAATVVQHAALSARQES